MLILLVEDDRKSAALMRKALEADAHRVELLHNGRHALVALEKCRFDGVILDIMLAGLDGIKVLQEMRARGDKTPVLLVSARGEVNEKVEGLDAGAEDYLAKPFALAEFVARVRALMRRRSELTQLTLGIGDLFLDVRTRTARRGDRTIELTAREFRLLEFLIRSKGSVCSRATLLEKVWDYDFDPGTNVVDVYIAKLREKVDQASELKLLHSVRGIGYVMTEKP